MSIPESPAGEPHASYADDFHPLFPDATASYTDLAIQILDATRSSHDLGLAARYEEK
ncbi:MAG: hypothetical protein ACOH19_15215 [Rhodoglobus sp.]